MSEKQEESKHDDEDESQSEANQDENEISDKDTVKIDVPITDDGTKINDEMTESYLMIKNNGVIGNDSQKRKWITSVYFFGQREQPQQNNSWMPWRQSEPEEPSKFEYEPETRNSFIKLVLNITLVMIIATAGFLTYVLATPSVRDYVRRLPFMLILIPLIVIIMVNYAFMCCECSRTLPCNIVLLILTVAAMSCIAAKISVKYRTSVILYATIATAAIVFVCILLACSSFDFTRYMLYLIVISFAFAVIVMIVLLMKIIMGVWMKPVVIALLSVGTIIQAILLVMEIQMIIGGRTIEINEDDYALAAWMLYTSILDIFLKMVQIIGLSSSD